MRKSIVINLRIGNLQKGFSRVTAQLWAAEHPLPEQFIGSLPAALALGELYKNWQSIYQNLCTRKQLLCRLQEEDDELEIGSGGITKVSQVGFDELCRQLQQSINQWLKSEEFLNIDRQLRCLTTSRSASTRLDTAEEIQVIIETDHELLRRLPWHRWNFFQDYPLTEMALT